MPKVHSQDTFLGGLRQIDMLVVVGPDEFWRDISAQKKAKDKPEGQLEHGHLGLFFWLPTTSIFCTSLSSFLSRDFLFYSILRTIVPGPKTPFRVIIIEEDHHGTKPHWPLSWPVAWGCPNKAHDIIPTPWENTHDLGFGMLMPRHE